MTAWDLCLLVLWLAFGIVLCAVMLPSFALGFLWCGCENTFRRGYRLFDTFIDWNP